MCRYKTRKIADKTYLILLCGKGSLPFPASGSPTARFAVANVNYGTFGFVISFVLRLCRVHPPPGNLHHAKKTGETYLLRGGHIGKMSEQLT